MPGGALSDSTTLTDWLDSLPADQGFSVISPPKRFSDGDEEFYESVVNMADTPIPPDGTGAMHLIRAHAKRPISTILELGAGPGTCSVGLANGLKEISQDYQCNLIITDTSSTFIRMCRNALLSRQLLGPEIRFATLAGEDIWQLPAKSIDAIVMEATLHHILDWRQFLIDACNRLRPGGVLVFQEPFREGYLLIAMVVELALSGKFPFVSQIKKGDRVKLEALKQFTYHMMNTTIDKNDQEDKHVFMVDDMFQSCHKAGFVDICFYRNAHFSNIDESSAGHPEKLRPVSINSYIQSYLANHYLVSPETISVLTDGLLKEIWPLDAVFLRGDGPPILGSMALVAP